MKESNDNERNRNYKKRKGFKKREDNRCNSMKNILAQKPEDSSPSEKWGRRNSWHRNDG